ncbi:MAG: ComF family protein [Clostridia bacterium]|nr:ComF family protein [Clostridia bacterium]
MDTIKKFFKKIADFINGYDDTHNFTCDICGREVFDNERVCDKCKKELPYIGDKCCPLCGRKVREAGVCLECKQKPLEVERARSVFTHEGEAARLVVRYKKGNRYLYRTLADLAEPLFMKEFQGCDLITSIPMTDKARKKRGYNQSKLLAEELAKRSGKLYQDTAVKQHETNAQKTLGRDEREKNLKGCFHIVDRKAVKEKIVLIVDDTLTTGSTVSELANALKRAGAKTVYALTVTSVEYKDAFGKPPKKGKPPHHVQEKRL